MSWSKINIKTENEGVVNAQAPIIVSASRSTDIPAFYSDWFIKRLKAGYVKWRNPFNGVPLYVTFQKTRLIVFWSKNPRPILKHMDFIHEKIPNYYFQFTLNDYDIEKLEPHVPNVNSRIETFIELSEKIGRNKVIWRFDPLILTDTIDVDKLLKKTEQLGDKLKNYTNKLVFSFADINTYKKVESNLTKHSVKYQEFNEKLMIEYAEGLQKLNTRWDFEIGTCAEKISMEKYDIIHNKCIDDDLIAKLFYKDKALMDFMGVKVIEPDIFNRDIKLKKTRKLKDSGQRDLCGCIPSKDIGQYNTCPHLCKYCYANVSQDVALKNWNKHKLNPNSEFITGE